MMLKLISNPEKTAPTAATRDLEILLKNKYVNAPAVISDTTGCCRHQSLNRAGICHQVSRILSQLMNPSISPSIIHPPLEQGTSAHHL